MSEANSNIHHPDIINSIDLLITPFTNDEFEILQPRILVTFGGMIVSKRIKSFLRKYKPRHHWHIDENRAYDTFGILTQHFQVSPNQFFSQFLPHVKALDSNYKSSFKNIISIRKKKRTTFLEKAPFSDLKVFDIIIKYLPKHCMLQVSNSSAIRYLQLFDVPKGISVFCNRGTSGIDGSTSTAIGAAVTTKKTTYFITGDISFFYDSNALWNNYVPKNFKIILVNNSGGGIFRILPGHEENTVFNTFFETSHSLTAKNLAEMHKFDYYDATDEKTLVKGLKDISNENNKPCILEVFTPEKENNRILKEFFNELD